MKGRREFLITSIMLPMFRALASGQTRSTKPRPEKARGPVCGIMVEKEPLLSARHNGRTYYFCSKADRDTFRKTPEKYLGKKD
jgi:YHS domain-containing protein